MKYLLLVANGTLALQVAYRALGVTGAVLTTPFTFVATTASLAWEGLEPIFVDVDRKSFNLDPKQLEASPPASAIVPVHVYGNPCDVEAIKRVARERSIPVIYDAAHAFGSTLDGQSLLRHGDAATLSFHATKIFHTIEGGAIVFRDEEPYRLARSLINFGQEADEAVHLTGLNAKLSEYHAAVGLILLDRIDEILEHRAGLVDEYQRLLGDCVGFQEWHPLGRPNGAYMPILLRDEAQLLSAMARLVDDGIQTRRYFWPSLNRLSWPRRTACPVSEDIASRVLCLPLYADLARSDVRQIAVRLRAALA